MRNLHAQTSGGEEARRRQDRAIMRILGSWINNRTPEYLNFTDDGASDAEYLGAKAKKACVLTACKLVDLWKYGSYNYQQKIQYLVFPDGLIWDKEKGKPRTTRENEVLMTIRLINNHLQKGTGQEKTGKSVDFSGLVAGAGLEPATSGL